jgi:hypothetical protein
MQLELARIEKLQHLEQLVKICIITGSAGLIGAEAVREVLALRRTTGRSIEGGR